MNGDSKNVIDSRPYDWNDQKTVSELHTRLTTKKDTSHSKYQNYSNYGMNSETNRSIESFTEYINICKNQNMMRTFQSGHINTEKNSDVAITNLRKNKIVDNKLTDNKSQLCSITVSIKYKTFIISLSQIEYR